MARRPRWIAALALCLGVAAAFAALGQWQLERSFEGGEVTEEQSETTVPLTSIAEPQQPMPSSTIGQRVSADLEFVPEDFLVLSDRINHDAPGYWVVGHAIVEETGASLTVALGWAVTEEQADAALAELEAAAPSGPVDGRYLATESPDQQDYEAGEQTLVAVPAFINEWSVAPDGVYGGYLVLQDAPAGLEAIDSPPPVTEVSLNLLNVFYAVEWVIFAGFAFYLWYRLVRDAVEAEDAEADSAAKVD
ncbi:SURF1 family protein [Schumannella luteola]